MLDLNAHIACLTSELEEGMAQCLQQKVESASTGTQGYKLSEMEVIELKTCIENMEHVMKSHVESFQQNLKFLKEKGEDNRREQADLLTELQCSQDTEDFLRRKLEESCNYVYNLKLSEIKLQKQVEDLLDENRVLKDQSRVKLKKKEEKDSQFTRLENRDSSADLVSKCKVKYNKLLSLYHLRLYLSLGVQRRCKTGFILPEFLSFISVDVLELQCLIHVTVISSWSFIVSLLLLGAH